MTSRSEVPYDHDDTDNTQTIKLSNQSHGNTPTHQASQARLPHAKPSTGEGQQAKEDPNQAPFHGSLQ